MKILSGAYEPNEGELLIDGQPIVFKGVADAKKHGIALIHQELMLAATSTSPATFSWATNDDPSAAGPMRRASMKKTSQELLDRVGLKLSAGTPVCPSPPAKCRWWRSPNLWRSTPARSSWTSQQAL